MWNYINTYTSVRYNRSKSILGPIEKVCRLVLVVIGIIYAYFNEYFFTICDINGEVVPHSISYYTLQNDNIYDFEARITSCPEIGNALLSKNNFTSKLTIPSNEIVDKKTTNSADFEVPLLVSTPDSNMIYLYDHIDLNFRLKLEFDSITTYYGAAQKIDVYFIVNDQLNALLYDRHAETIKYEYYGENILTVPFMVGHGMYKIDNPTTMNFCPYAITGLAFNINTNCRYNWFHSTINCEMTTKQVYREYVLVDKSANSKTFGILINFNPVTGKYKHITLVSLGVALLIIYEITNKVHLVINILIKYSLIYYKKVFRERHGYDCQNPMVNDVLVNLDDTYITHNVSGEIDEDNKQGYNELLLFDDHEHVV